MNEFIRRIALETQLDYSSSTWAIEHLISLGSNLKQIKEIYEKDGLYGLKHLSYILMATHHISK